MLLITAIVIKLVKLCSIAMHGSIDIGGATTKISTPVP